MGGDGERTRLCYSAWLKGWQKEGTRCCTLSVLGFWSTHCWTTSSEFSLVWTCILEHTASDMILSHDNGLLHLLLPCHLCYWPRQVRQLFFVLLKCIVQALDRQRSRKVIRESTKSQTAATSSFTAKENKISRKELSHFKDHCINMKGRFLSVPQSSPYTAASVPTWYTLSWVTREICWKVQRKRLCWRLSCLFGTSL